MIRFAWHVHHDVLIEPLTAPLKERIAHIKANKPKTEQALRLRLLKPVRGSLPSAYEEAWAAYKEAQDAYEEAWAAYKEAWAAYKEAWVAYKKAGAAYEKALDAYEKAWAAYEKALDAYKKVRASCIPEISALHTQECPDCPWDGQTIFSKKEA